MRNLKNKIDIKLKIQIEKEIQFGPGKVFLMEAIKETGSISGAAKKIGMSYRKAWKLINDLNKMAKTKMVATSTGGKGSGGTKLTSTGVEFIAIYRNMEHKVLDAIKNEKLKLEEILNNVK